MKPELIKKFKQVRKLFPHTGDSIYLNTASYCAFSSTVADAIDNMVKYQLESKRDSTALVFNTADELRSDFAKLIGARKSEIGLGWTTSHGINVAAYGLPMKKGDEVLISDVEFPAIPYVFKGAAQNRGWKIRYIKARNGFFDIGNFKKAITKRTKALALSSVQFFNGYKNDLQTISEICKKHGIFFIVDGIQGMGVEPINVHKLGIDIFMSGCQKWMLSPQSSGFFYVADEIRDRMAQPFMSWHEVDWKMNFSDLFKFDLPIFESAHRFEMGYYNVFGIMGMKAAVKIFQDLGIKNIRTHNHALIDRLAAYIDRDDFYRITCSMEPKHRSSIFTFTCQDYKKLHQQILKRGIVCSLREGSIRISPHLYNNENDIDGLIEVLDCFAKKN